MADQKQPKPLSKAKARLEQLQQAARDQIFDSIPTFPRDIAQIVAVFAVRSPVRWRLTKEAQVWSTLSDDGKSVQYRRSAPGNRPFWLEVLGDTPLTRCANTWTVSIEPKHERPNVWVGVAHRSRRLTTQRRVDISMSTRGHMSRADDSGIHEPHSPISHQSSITVWVDIPGRRVYIYADGVQPRFVPIPASDSLDHWVPVVSVNSTSDNTRVRIVDHSPF